LRAAAYQRQTTDVPEQASRTEVHETDGIRLLITGAATGIGRASAPAFAGAGAAVGMKHQLARMAKAGRGAIVNTASVAGLRADPGMARYGAAKHAAQGLTKAAAIDYATQGIRVNAIERSSAQRPVG
jgi:NAD(P)-dependent dehydrogenase (short-subunit alcohol dehydrogenase family)